MISTTVIAFKWDWSGIIINSRTNVFLRWSVGHWILNLAGLIRKLTFSELVQKCLIARFFLSSSQLLAISDAVSCIRILKTSILASLKYSFREIGSLTRCVVISTTSGGSSSQSIWTVFSSDSSNLHPLLGGVRRRVLVSSFFRCSSIHACYPQSWHGAFASNILLFYFFALHRSYSFYFMKGIPLDLRAVHLCSSIPI